MVCALVCNAEIKNQFPQNHFMVLQSKISEKEKLQNVIVIRRNEKLTYCKDKKFQFLKCTKRNKKG